MSKCTHVVCALIVGGDHCVMCKAEEVASVSDKGAPPSRKPSRAEHANHTHSGPFAMTVTGDITFLCGLRSSIALNEMADHAHVKAVHYSSVSHAHYIAWNNLEVALRDAVGTRESEDE